MRTAVVRISVDPSGELTREELAAGIARLRESAGAAGFELVEDNLAHLAELPPARREVELLMTGDDAGGLQSTALALCRDAFGTEPVPGVVTFISRGTDDDALGVLANCGWVVLEHSASTWTGGVERWRLTAWNRVVG